MPGDSQPCQVEFAFPGAVGVIQSLELIDGEGDVPRPLHGVQGICRGGFQFSACCCSASRFAIGFQHLGIASFMLQVDRHVTPAGPMFTEETVAIPEPPRP